MEKEVFIFIKPSDETENKGIEGLKQVAIERS